MRGNFIDRVDVQVNDDWEILCKCVHDFDVFCQTKPIFFLNSDAHI